MLDIFVLALVLGGAMLAFALLMGDADMDAGGDADWGRIVSLRSLTYFIFGFGAAGTTLRHWAGEEGLSLYLISTVVGLALAAVAEAIFRYLELTDSGAMEPESVLVGRHAQVTLPLRADGPGKISVDRGGQVQTLIARPVEGAEGDPATWHHVVIVEMRSGEALVTPMQGLPPLAGSE